jgi:ribonuclease BN (tRNA processing enzyme)
VSGLHLARGADVLIHDAQYTTEEHAERLGWGHSSVDEAIAFARRAQVGKLVLFHHDPARTDDQMDVLAMAAADLAASTANGLQVTAGREGDQLLP